MELSRRYLSKAEEVERQAEAVRRKTSRARTTQLPILIIMLGVMSTWTASVFVSIGAPWIVAILIACVLHGGLALLIHTAFTSWARGEIGRVVWTGLLATLLLTAFVGLACFRAYHAIEDGNDPLMSFLMAAIYCCLEMSLPVALGAEFAHRCHADEVACEDRNFYKKVANDIREDMVDAPGIWDDHEASLEAQVREIRHHDAGTTHERKRLDQLGRQLRRLREAQPGKRYRDLTAKAAAHTTEFTDPDDPPETSLTATD